MNNNDERAIKILRRMTYSLLGSFALFEVPLICGYVYCCVLSLLHNELPQTLSNAFCHAFKHDLLTMITINTFIDHVYLQIWTDLWIAWEIASNTPTRTKASGKYWELARYTGTLAYGFLFGTLPAYIYPSCVIGLACMFIRNDLIRGFVRGWHSCMAILYVASYWRFIFDWLLAWQAEYVGPNPVVDCIMYWIIIVYLGIAIVLVIGWINLFLRLHDYFSG